MEEFKFKIKTSDKYLTAGTKCAINLKLTGETGASTNWIKLGQASLFSDSFQKGSTNEYVVQHDGDYIGPPIVLTIKLTGIFVDYWLCDTVTVEYRKTQFEFIVFDWILKEEVIVTVGGAQLPQHIKEKAVTSIRKSEIDKNKKKYQWLPDPTPESFVWGLNRYMNAFSCFDLPCFFRRTQGRLKCLGKTGFEVLYQTGSNYLKSFFTQMRDLDDYKSLYRDLGCEEPTYIERWKSDEETGRQVLNGVSPLAFSKCTEIPGYCNVDDEVIKGLLPPEESLQSAIKKGKVFISDYVPLTKDVPRNTNPSTSKPYVCADCIGLFCYNENGDFVPIAIQLIPNDPESIFTPNDAEYDWLLAKMYFRSTMQSVHEWIYHFLYTHGLSETIAIATFRCFSCHHPIYKLLRPHLSTAPTINTDARFIIFPKGSLANRSLQLSGVECIRNVYKVFVLDDLDIPKLLQRNGTIAKNLLPNYYYRDDALDIWKTMEDFVEKIIKFYYKSDQDVKEDFELQDWAADLVHEGIAWQDGNARGFPHEIVTIDQLSHLCTIIMFTSSAQHAAVNFGQMETYQFVPNSPGAMCLPIHKRGEGSLQRIISTLPSATVSSLSLSFSYALSAYAEDEVFLGSFPERLFPEPEIVKMQNEFTEALQDLSEKFKKRNECVDYPYTYLLPEKIPNSITI